MAGFCAGQRGKQTLGDVVIAEKVFNYDLGKQISENKIQPQISSYKLDGRIKQKIERYGNNWRSSIKISLPKDFQLQCYEFLQELLKYEDGVEPQVLYNKVKDVLQIFANSIGVSIRVLEKYLD